jgi:hypothetical protein
MTFFLMLFLSLAGVTPGPGWSWPIIVTEEPNTYRPNQLLHMDDQGRFHLLWTDYRETYRIGYKVFLVDGTTVVPDTMISRDTSSAYLTKTAYCDSLYAFWREYDPIYYAVRSLEDGSELVPATYILTTYTYEPYIRASPDCLGRLHVLYNSGADVVYAVWVPQPGGGFYTDYEWVVPGIVYSGSILVDGNRVHIVAWADTSYTHEYLQYDLEGNLIVPRRDFTAEDMDCRKYPELALDPDGNLIVVDAVNDVSSTEPFRFAFWKLDGETGETLIDETQLAIGIPPDMYIGPPYILRPLPGSEAFYLCWRDSGWYKVIWYMVIDDEGNVLKDWEAAYDYSDEDPEDLRGLDGVVDDVGNLFIVYGAIETEPELDRWPTFGWFDHTYLGIEEEEEQTETFISPSIAASCNPVTGSVSFTVTGSAPNELEIYDISGRLVTTVPININTAFWDGKDASGNRLPYGVYRVSYGDVSTTVTLLGE